MSLEEFERKLAQTAKRGERVRSARVERDESGRARQVEFSSDKGTFKVGGGEFRFDIGLKSSPFEMELDARTVVFTARGWGPGAGLCQEGAVAMARAGNDYRRIPVHYYPGARGGRP